MTNARLYLRKTVAWFEGLRFSERILITSCGLSLFAYLLFISWEMFESSIETNRRAAIQKTREYNEIAISVENFLILNKRRQEIQARLAASEMNFDKLGYEIDNIVKSVLQNSNYEPKRAPSNTPFGGDYEKQELKLVISSIKPEQLLELLYKFEKSEKPIFLSRADISKASGGKELAVSLELYIIAKTEKIA